MNTSPQNMSSEHYEIVVRTGTRLNSVAKRKRTVDYATVTIYLNGSKAYELSVPHSWDMATRVKSATEE